MGPELGVRVLDSTQLTWLNDCYGKEKEKEEEATKEKKALTLTNTTSLIGVKRYLAVDVEFDCC